MTPDEDSGQVLGQLAHGSVTSSFPLRLSVAFMVKRTFRLPSSQGLTISISGLSHGNEGRFPRACPSQSRQLQIKAVSSAVANLSGPRGFVRRGDQVSKSRVRAVRTRALQVRTSAFVAHPFNLDHQRAKKSRQKCTSVQLESIVGVS